MLFLHTQKNLLFAMMHLKGIWWTLQSNKADAIPSIELKMQKKAALKIPFIALRSWFTSMQHIFPHQPNSRHQLQQRAEQKGVVD